MFQLYGICVTTSPGVRWFHVLGCTAYNLGTGQGTSVLEMVAAFEKASGKVCLSLSLTFSLFL